MRALAEKRMYVFSGFCLDPARRRLTRDGETVVLNPKTFDLLLTLVENRDRVLSKNELLNAVWEGQFVEEGNLPVQIFALRKIFGEKKDDHRFIVTFPGKGYRFVADVQNGFSSPARRPALAKGSGDDQQGAPAARMIFDMPEEASPRNLPEYDPSSLASVKLTKLAIVAACVVVAGIVLYVVVRDASVGSPLTADANNQPRIRQLTTKGRVGVAAISRNGEFYAYTTDLVGERKRSLWIAQVRGGNDIELRPPDDNLIRGVAFSPDGETLYFTLANSDESEGGLFQIPILGGVEKKLANSPNRSFSLSPDGTQLAYFRGSEDRDDVALVVANLDGTGEREAVTRPADMRFGTRAPAWSPDGSMLAFGAIKDKSIQSNEIFVIRVEDGQTQQLTNLDWKLVYSLVWRPDGRGLIAIAIDKAETLRHVWHVEYPGGTVSRLSSDTVDYGQALSISGDGKSLLAVQASIESNIWVAPSSDLSKARQISFSSINGAFGWNGLEWTPDNRIVFVGGVQRNMAIFTMSAKGNDIQQITSGGFYDRQPTVSPDGRIVVFCSDRSRTNEIWRVNVDGADIRQITSGGGCSPDITPDGTSVVYVSNRSGKETLWSIPLEGGESVQLTAEETLDPKVSPDGKFIACGYRKDEKSPLRLAILNIRDGSLVGMFDMPRSTNFNGGIAWIPGGKAITIRDWASGIWKQDLGGGTPAALEGLPQEKLFGYDWSRDGRTFAFSRGRAISDAVLITLDPKISR